MVFSLNLYKTLINEEEKISPTGNLASNKDFDILFEKGLNHRYGVDILFNVLNQDEMEFLDQKIK